LAVAVARGWTAGADAWLSLALGNPLRTAAWPVPLMIAATTIGGAAVRLPLAALVAGVLALRGDRVAGLAVAASALGMLLLNMGLKLLFGRARPELLPHLAVETSLSFPSGHAANGAAVFWVLAWALVRQGAPAALMWCLAAVLVAAIGVSRVVLGVHWPSDVVAGWCVGGGWALICVAVAERRRARA
jgi:undecaprenyl-diphosphatase